MKNIIDIKQVLIVPQLLLDPTPLTLLTSQKLDLITLGVTLQNFLQLDLTLTCKLTSVSVRSWKLLASSSYATRP